MQDMNEQQHSTQQFDFCLMEVKFNLLELFILGTNVTKSLQDVPDIGTSA